MIDRYQARPTELADALAGDAERQRGTIQVLREFVDRVEVGPSAAPHSPATLVAYGLLPRVLQFAAGRQQHGMRTKC